MLVLNNKNSRYSKGFSLLEVLIAVVILSVGLLALASLQTRGLASGHNAYLRSQAVLLAQDLAERIRANSDYAIQAGNNNYLINLGNNPPNQDCSNAACTPGQIASFDLNQWITSINTVLPQGAGQVTRVNANPVQYQIIVQWNASQQPNNQAAGANPALNPVKNVTLNVTP